MLSGTGLEHRRRGGGGGLEEKGVFSHQTPVEAHPNARGGEKEARLREADVWGEAALACVAPPRFSTHTHTRPVPREPQATAFNLLNTSPSTCMPLPGNARTMHSCQ